jgi:hypothetical protein
LRRGHRRAAGSTTEQQVRAVGRVRKYTGQTESQKRSTPEQQASRVRAVRADPVPFTSARGGARATPLQEVHLYSKLPTSESGVRACTLWMYCSVLPWSFGDQEPQLVDDDVMISKSNITCSIAKAILPHLVDVLPRAL